MNIIGKDFYHGNCLYPSRARALAVVDASELTAKEIASFKAVQPWAKPEGVFVRLHNFGRRKGYRRSATQIRVFNACYFETADALTVNNTRS